MYHYLFEIVSEWSKNCGKQFFVQCETKEEANDILSQLFWGEQIEYIGRFTDEEAEEMIMTLIKEGAKNDYLRSRNIFRLSRADRFFTF